MEKELVMGDEVVGEDKRKPKGRGRGLTVRSNNVGKVGCASTKKEKEYEEMDEVKEEKERGAKVRKTRAGFEPYQVKKSRSINASLEKVINSAEKESHKLSSQISSTKRSLCVGKHDHGKGNEKQDKLDKPRDTKLQTRYDQKNGSQNRLRSNNSNNCSGNMNCNDDDNVDYCHLNNNNSSNSSSSSNNNNINYNNCNSNKSRSSNSSNILKKNSNNRHSGTSNNNTDSDTDTDTITTKSTTTTTTTTTIITTTTTNTNNNNNNSPNNNNIDKTNDGDSDNNNNNNNNNSNNDDNNNSSYRNNIYSNSSSNKNNSNNSNNDDDPHSNNQNSPNSPKNNYNDSNNYHNSYNYNSNYNYTNNSNNNDNNIKRSNYRSHTNKEKLKHPRRKKGSNENVISSNDRLNRKKNYHGLSDANVLQLKSRNSGANENTHSQSSDIFDDASPPQNDQFRFKPHEMRRLVLLQEQSSKYIDSLNDVSVQDLTQLSDTDTSVTNDESSIVIQGAMEELEDSEQVCCTPETHSMTEEELKLIKEIDRDHRNRGLGILQCPCLLGLDGERLGYCNAYNLIADHNSMMSALSPERNNAFSEAESEKKSFLLEKKWNKLGDELGADHLILDINMADLDLDKDGISGHNKYSCQDSPKPILEPGFDATLSVVNVVPGSEANIPSCLNVPHSSLEITGGVECVSLSTSQARNLDVKDVNSLLTVKHKSTLDSNISWERMSSQSIRQLSEHIPQSEGSPNSTRNLDKIINRYTILSKSDTALLNHREMSPEYNVSSTHSCPLLFDFDIPSRSNVVTCNPIERCVEFIKKDAKLAQLSDIEMLNEGSFKNSGDLLDHDKYDDDIQKIGNIKKRVLFNGSVDIESGSRKFSGDNELNGENRIDKDCDSEEIKRDVNDTDKRISTDISDLHSGGLIDIICSEEREKLEQSASPKNLAESLCQMSNDSSGDIGKMNSEYRELGVDKPEGMSNKRNSDLSVKISPSIESERYVEANRRQVRLPQHTFDGRFSTSSSKHDDDSYMVREYMNTIKDKQFQLKKLLQRGFQSLEGVNVMLAMSEAIQQKFGELIVHNQEYSFRHNFENSLWKLAFYSIIAKFRLFLEDQNVPHSAVQKIGILYWDFLQNGIQFLDAIIVQLQKQANFDLNSYLKDPIKISSCNKQVKFALRSCHLLLIFMGDLERYVSQFLQEDDYHNAKRYYKQAQILTPKNGKSYNQLAVIAVVTKHKLDAVYYYARSLQVSIPFLTAKDRLTAIFQEIQKKASKLKQTRIKRMTSAGTSSVASCGYIQDETPNSRGASNQNEYSNRNQISSISFNRVDADSYDRNTFDVNISSQNNTDHLRDEVWIFHRKNMKMFKVMLTKQNDVIDLTPKPITPCKEDSNVTKFSLNEINRTYMILFLFVHCKLYTNIGLEEFTYIHQETLSDLTTLLRHPKASSIRKENLLKCIVINIFSVHNIMEKNGHEDVIPNTALDLAIMFGMDMIGVLSKHCVELLDKDISQLSKADQFLPAIRVWLQWLISHSELVKKSSVSSMLDIWSEVCKFFDKINSLPRDSSIDLVVDGNENCYLEEDLLMAGLKSLNNSLLFCSPEKAFENRAVSELRLQNMLELVKQLDECGNLPFTYDEKEHTYKPVLSTPLLSTSPVKKAKDLDVYDEVDALDDVIIEDDDEEDMSHVNELKTQKAVLTKKVQESECARQAAMSVLESHRLQGRHLSENCPAFLVADTNCYIDHLGSIYSILSSQDFTLVVPLVVINELDGLKKGFYFDPSKFHEHQRKVQQSAQLAIKFLEDGFSQGNTNLRAMTSNGNELDTILFRAEEFSKDRGTNDDIILSCCLRYCKECKIDTVDATGIISREVALLTSDRNLRLKAHARVVPTIDILTFMKMARFV